MRAVSTTLGGGPSEDSSASEWQPGATSAHRASSEASLCSRQDPTIFQCYHGYGRDGAPRRESVRAGVILPLRPASLGIPMDPHLAFWTAALVDLLAVVTLIAFGVRSIRRGQLSRHRRCMRAAAVLVACFLAGYLVKLHQLGRERLSEWSEPAVAILRIHELCVFAMIVGGAGALALSRKMRGERNRLAQLPDAPLASSRVLAGHRRAGWTVAIAAGLGFLTAAIVLEGMYERAANR